MLWTSSNFMEKGTHIQGLPLSFLPLRPSHPFKTARCPYHAEPTNATYILKMQFQLPRACNHVTSRNSEKGNRSSMRCNGLHSSSGHIQTHNPRPSGVGTAFISGCPCQRFSIRPITTLRVPQVLTQAHIDLVQSWFLQSLQRPRGAWRWLAAKGSLHGALKGSSLEFAFLTGGQQYK